jgi:hypothetical protein
MTQPIPATLFAACDGCLNPFADKGCGKLQVPGNAIGVHSLDGPRFRIKLFEEASFAPKDDLDKAMQQHGWLVESGRILCPSCRAEGS